MKKQIRSRTFVTLLKAPSCHLLWAALFFSVLSAFTFGTVARAADPSWDQLAAAAKSEGKVVVIGPAHPEARQAIPTAFKKRFGIDVEYLGGPAGLAATRLIEERRAGIYTADVSLAAIQTLSTVFYKEKMLEPLKPMLVMPEALDKTKWKRGDLWFPDPEHEYVLRLFNSVEEIFSINTDYVKPADMTSARDLLLNPKFKGKIAAHDPTVTGTGSALAAQFYVQLGEDFVKKLYVDQQPMISRDERQLTDWLLRGVYPIAFGADDAQIDEMSKEGMPVQPNYGLPGLDAQVAGGNGLLVAFNHAPHPNAAKLFVNWMASKEGLETYARAVKWSPTRNDIDEPSFLPPQVIPKPGVEYFDGYDWEFSNTTKTKVRLWMKDLLGR
jgi:ABC-type Fe3+ transport system substrate-binding protein